MPNQKLSEYQVKMLWNDFIGNSQVVCDYINCDNKPELHEEFIEKLVVKIDDGSKRRYKRGLVKLDQTRTEVHQWVKERNDDANYFVEPMTDHVSMEYYVMIRPENNQDVLYFNTNGGIGQLNPLIGASRIAVNLNDEIRISHFDMPELNSILESIFRFYRHYHFTFLEVNPLAKITQNGCTDKFHFKPLDFAVLMDDCAEYLFGNTETTKNIKEILEFKTTSVNKYEIEKYIRGLDMETGGSLKFKLLNPSGKIWTLIAGGGASVVYTDAIVNMGYKDQLANYGEYSGDPPTDLVYKYVDAVLKQMENVDGDKILFIGGGIANFTDVQKTFTGLLKAMGEHLELFKSTKIYVRRGGPNYKVALQDFKEFAEKNKIRCEVHGPEMEITQIISQVLKPIGNKDENNNETQNELIIKYREDNEIKDSVNLKNIKNPHYNLTNTDQCIIYSYHPKAVQRMLDFDYINGRDTPSIAAVVEPRKLKDTMDKFFWGDEPILLPILNNLGRCLTKYKRVKHIVSFSSFRTAFESTMDILDYEHIESITIIAEGIPEQHTRIFNEKAKNAGKIIIGPATVGSIKPGCLRVANTGGDIDNIINSRLFKSGSVGFVTRSGGLLNELCNVVSKKTDGVFQGVSIGGDRNPGSNFIDHILNYQNIEEVKMIILLGEVGGTQELLVANAVKTGIITKPVIGWCMGTSAEYLSDDIQFGHAGASVNSDYESASFKNKYMKESGIHVPECFENLSGVIEDIYKKIRGDSWVDPLSETPEPPRQLPTTKKDVCFFSSISNEMGPELKYNGINISDIVNGDGGIGKVIGHLWLKKELPLWMCKYIELVIMIVADHGAMVSGAHNTIVASRAGKDLISSVCSGMLTIGDYFGGALNEAGVLFYEASKKESAFEFISRMKKENKIISGIGHKIKTKENPDKRVEILHNYAKEHFTLSPTIKYGFLVEELTLKKRNNLILNVDGFIACSLVDCMLILEMTGEEIDEVLDNGLFNGFFVLGRTIGLIGHWYDQKRLKQGLFRQNADDVKYMD